MFYYCKAVKDQFITSSLKIALNIAQHATIALDNSIHKEFIGMKTMTGVI